MLRLTLVIPVPDDSPKLWDGVVRTMASLDELGVDHRVLIVDDAALAQVPALPGDRVQVIRHPERYGLWQALYLGLVTARGELTMYLPADLTLGTKELAQCLQAVQGADFVAVTYAGRAVPLSRRACAVIVRALFGLSLNPFPDACICRTAPLQEIWIEYPDSEFIKAELLIKSRDMGYRLREVQVNCSMPSARVPGVTARWGYDLLHFWAHWLLKERKGGRRDWRVGVPEHE